MNKIINLLNYISKVKHSMQIIVVVAKSKSDTKGLLYTYEKINGLWTQIFAPINASLGRNGITKDKYEGDGKTPQGIFEVSYAFGWCKKPETSLPYRHTGPDDYWVSGKSIDMYNVWIHKEGGPDTTWEQNEYERLNHPLYKYALVINYNMGSKKVLGKGSAIFLHCARKGLVPTAGCIGIPENDMIKILNWLKTEKNPTIAIRLST